MKRFPFLVCLAFVLLLVMGGIASADMTLSTNATINATTTAATPSPDRTGGSIFFETDPAGATVWVDNNQIGTSDLTYYSEKTGTLSVIIRRKGYEDYTASVTVEEGRRIEFFAKLLPLPRGITPESTPAPTQVTTATTIRKSTLDIPTPWPTTTQSPVDPAVVSLAAAAGIGFFAIRRR